MHEATWLRGGGEAVIIVEGLRKEDWAKGGGRCTTSNGQDKGGRGQPRSSCSYLWYGERAANQGQEAL